MSVIKQTITDAEYEIMCVLWNSDELLTVADIIKKLDNNDWSASTVATFMARLLKKEVISCERKGKVNYYYPVLKQSEYAIDETENLLAKMFKGSIKNLVATLYENKKPSKEEVADLKKMFELE
ncbi:MAG: BlaI/MecI/CopY family transcriptional regulator [Ruminococcaceae bacterium]|nr:BlaI/MecI/CopY family transcriptional regulator [Oscillospiraceae bacterium]